MNYKLNILLMFLGYIKNDQEFYGIVKITEWVPYIYMYVYFIITLKGNKILT